ncbi:D-aminoacyl-tRNA deacylase [Francisella frigiditurris]|uniref:D-aminoacyl-tRNA deacylase n=1 Tax=Francisella frigiditurris TaxID=1542390 RepID=A0A1J0KVU7_9GAMM|nr:D-aminoacyl-tRNA deacylase [Francisella frigiditurris]APC97917.1 D-tyrosyl-tRNA(Tyr) deacylase [Francisella frigiditurris]
MLAVVQRVSCASVSVDNLMVGSINKGLMALVCIEPDDLPNNFEKMADKLINYRIFEDENNKMNLSVSSINGGILIVPQFTLAAETKKGLRPSFSNACPPSKAKELFERFVEIIKSKYSKIETGVFGADMKVSLVNDGPVTFNFKV